LPQNKNLLEKDVK